MAQNLTQHFVSLGNNLLAGERRLRACKLKTWKEIPCQLFADLTDETRIEIEREENEQRKGLTTSELSKKMVRQAEVVAPLIAAKRNNLSVDDLTLKPTVVGEREVSTTMVETSLGGRPSTYAVPKKDIAQALGVSTMSLVNAEQHVAAINNYPELAAIGNVSDGGSNAKVTRSNAKEKGLAKVSQSNSPCQPLQLSRRNLSQPPDTHDE
jgi:ribosomal protein L18